MERDNLKENSLEMGKILRNGLENLKEKYPKIIGDVRGKGLMQGVELVEDESKGNRTPNIKGADQFMEETKKRGLLIGRGGIYGTALRIAPPLIISNSEVEEA